MDEDTTRYELSAEGQSRLEHAEQARHAKITRRAKHGRDKLDQHPQPTPKMEAARQRLSDWERRQHEKHSQDVQKAREELARVEETVQDKLDKKSSAA
jgi:hypothetical protein